MPIRSEAIILGAVLAFVMWRMSQANGSTAGDQQSNVLSDAMNTLQSKVTGGWPTGSEPYQDLITRSAQGAAVPVSILSWLLWKESRYNPEVIDGSIVSPVGALGIAQFMPATARDLGIDPLDPNQAIPAAANYLGRLYSARGTWHEALAAYNWGIGNVARRGIDNAPPETVDYFTTILGNAGYEVTA